MLKHYGDYRIANNPRFYLAEEDRHSMQVVPDEVRKCVAFILCKTDAGMTIRGTAFFVSVPFESVAERQFIYLVTAKHVIDKIGQVSVDQKVYIRLNTKENGAQVIQSDLSAWKFHPDDEVHVDAAAIGWEPSQETFDYKTIPLSMAVTDEVVIKEQIGAGDEVFLTGLFHKQYGNQKNLPIIRTGSIAMMPEEPIYTTGFGTIDAYLVEARSIGGLSGSPVFVYMGHMRAKNGNISFGGGSQLFYWLGLMHGHWDVDEHQIDSVESNGNTHVNMGIGIVVPVTKIIELINREDFMQQRKQVEEENKKRNAPTVDSLEETMTKEEFEKTLKKVSRKIKPSESDPTKTKT